MPGHFGARLGTLPPTAIEIAMTAVDPVPYPAPASQMLDRGTDQRVFLRNLAWADYERLLDVRGESAVPRLTYLNGTLELMTPAINHERDKTSLARLIEASADETGVELEGFGSWTLKSRLKGLGAEPDECYVVGPLDGEPSLPDFVIEVVRSSGGIDKLEVYRRLGVPEVWFWQHGRLSLYGLAADGSGYALLEHSRQVPTMPPALLEQCMQEPTQTRAVRRLRAALQH
jgi:Uma2 family endonuclease